MSWHQIVAADKLCDIYRRYMPCDATLFIKRPSRNRQIDVTELDSDTDLAEVLSSDRWIAVALMLKRRGHVRCYLTPGFGQFSPLAVEPVPWTLMVQPTATPLQTAADLAASTPDHGDADRASFPYFWFVFPYFLSWKTRNRIYWPACTELLADYLVARQDFQGKWARRWIRFAFTWRTAILVLDCAWAGVKARIGMILPIIIKWLLP